METIIKCTQCKREHLPGEARFCARCGTELPTESIQVPDRLKLDEKIGSRYGALAFMAGLQVFFGWVAIIAALFVGMMTYTVMLSALGALPNLGSSQPTYVYDGAPQPTERPSSQSKTEYNIAAGLAVIVTALGIFSGARMIAAGQQAYLFIDLSNETSIATREMLRFFHWYAKKERMD